MGPSRSTSKSRAGTRSPSPTRSRWSGVRLQRCAVSTAFHALTISGLRKGDTALVFGAGGHGPPCCDVGPFLRAGKVIAVDPIESKLGSAKKYGAKVTL